MACAVAGPQVQHAGLAATARPAPRRPAVVARAAAAAAEGPEPATTAAALPLSRRGLLGSAAATAALAVSAGGAALTGSWAAPPAAEALELAPLGAVERVGGDKLRGLTPDQVKVSGCNAGIASACSSYQQKHAMASGMGFACAASGLWRERAGGRMQGWVRGRLPPVQHSTCSTLPAALCSAGHPGEEPAGRCTSQWPAWDRGALVHACEGTARFLSPPLTVCPSPSSFQNLQGNTSLPVT